MDYKYVSKYFENQSCRRWYRIGLWSTIFVIITIAILTFANGGRLDEFIIISLLCNTPSLTITIVNYLNLRSNKKLVSLTGYNKIISDYIETNICDKASKSLGYNIDNYNTIITRYNYYNFFGFKINSDAKYKRVLITFFIFKKGELDVYQDDFSCTTDEHNESIAHFSYADISNVSVENNKFIKVVARYGNVLINVPVSNINPQDIIKMNNLINQK